MNQRPKFRVFLIILLVSMLSSCGRTGNPQLLTGDAYVLAGSTGIGTSDSPFGSVQEAIDSVSAPATILVAVGTYTEDIAVKDGVSLLGGCNTDFTDRAYQTESDRENHLYRTVLVSTRTSGGASGDPVSSVLCSGAIGPDTTIEGFVVTGGSATFDAALRCDTGAAPTIRYNSISGISTGMSISRSFGIFSKDSAPTIENNIITGRDTDAAVAAGIWCEDNPTTVTISGNTIYGGDDASDSYGIRIDGTATVEIEGNDITGGNSSTYQSFAVYSNNMSVEITDNFISGGSTTATASSGSYGITGSCSVIRNNLVFGGGGDSHDTIGISINNNPEIANNTICAGPGTDFSVGIICGGHPEVKNNIIFTTASGSSSYDGVGLMENGGDDTDPAALQNNCFFDCPIGHFVDQVSTTWTPYDHPDINDYNYTTQSASAPSTGNVSVDLSGYLVDFTGPDGDPGSLADNDWRLTAAADLTVRGGGMDLSSDFDVDIDGNSRTTDTPTGATNTDAAGWSMGACEID